MKNIAHFYIILLIISLLFSSFPVKVNANSIENTTKCHTDLVSMTVGQFSDELVNGFVQQNTIKKKKPKGFVNNGKRKVTFENFEENYKKAKDYYDRQLFISAAKLFEELYPMSMGTPLADTILYLFADCYYQNKDYEMAAFHFKEYANRYTSNPRAQLAHFQAINALSHLSPEYSLDQTQTYYVIEEIEVFIRNYPNSEYMPECNALLDKMRDKLAKKSFEILKLYYETENYKAAQVAARNFLKEYSSTQYADDAYAIWVKNNYEYARHSVESKKIERYTECLDVFHSFEINFPSSPLVSDMQKYADLAQGGISHCMNKILKNKKNNEDRFEEK